VAKYVPAKLPKMTTILGERFVVESAAQPEGEDDSFGDHCAAERKIRVFPYAATEQMVLRTYIHETLHAALAVSGCKELLAKKENQDPEEALVVLFETHIMQQLPAWIAMYRKAKGER
jgi:hypothetical protein